MTKKKKIIIISVIAGIAIIVCAFFLLLNNPLKGKWVVSSVSYYRNGEKDPLYYDSNGELKGLAASDVGKVIVFDEHTINWNGEYPIYYKKDGDYIYTTKTESKLVNPEKCKSIRIINLSSNELEIEYDYSNYLYSLAHQDYNTTQRMVLKRS